MSKEIGIALIAAATSLIGATISAAVALRTQRIQSRLEVLRGDIIKQGDKERARLQSALETTKISLQRDLEQSKFEFQQDAAEVGALREYKFDARKRLYAQCEPILFQITESAESALDHCRNLVRPDLWSKLKLERHNLDSSTGHWMLCRSSELISVLYALLSPLALYLILRDRMTVVDFTLDPGVFLRYRLVKQLYESFQNDAEVAKLSPILEYNPRVDNWRQKRLEAPAVYWWQGTTRGRLDRAARLLIVDHPQGNRLMSFGEFEDLYTEIYYGTDQFKQKMLGVVANALYGFTPMNRPVFLRLLFIWIHLYRGLCKSIPPDASLVLASPDRIRQYLKLTDEEISHWKIFLLHDSTLCDVALDYVISRLHIF